MTLEKAQKDFMELIVKNGFTEDYYEQIRYDAEQNYKTASADKGQTD